MGTSAGTLSWEPHERDAEFLAKFQTWAVGVDYNSCYAKYVPNKTKFAIDSSGFWRDPQRVRDVLDKCELELRRNDVEGIEVSFDELPI